MPIKKSIKKRVKRKTNVKTRKTKKRKTMKGGTKKYRKKTKNRKKTKRTKIPKKKTKTSKTQHMKNFPTELLGVVGDFLDHKDKKHLRLTEKRMARDIKVPEQVQYTLMVGDYAMSGDYYNPYYNGFPHDYSIEYVYCTDSNSDPEEIKQMLLEHYMDTDMRNPRNYGFPRKIDLDNGQYDFTELRFFDDCKIPNTILRRANP